MQDYQPQNANLTHYLFFTGKGGVGKTTPLIWLMLVIK